MSDGFDTLRERLITSAQVLLLIGITRLHRCWRRRQISVHIPLGVRRLP